MGCLPRLKSPISTGFEIRDFSSPRMTAGNAIQPILPGPLVLRNQVYPRVALSRWFETVLPREDQESDLTTRGYMLRIALWDIF